jgi:TolB protein
MRHVVKPSGSSVLFFASFALLAFLALLIARVPSGAAYPGVTGRIAFVTDRDAGNNDIYSMNPDGTNPTRLTTNAAIDDRPTWSPNGAAIAFHSVRDGNYEIYTMNADGSGQTNISNNAADDLQPTWSGDGTKIAFASSRDGNVEIYSMNANGTGQTRLTFNAAQDVAPAWSPDGTKIAFVSMRDGNREIYSMNADGTSQTRLTNNAAEDTEPDWSPDSTKIAFETFRDGNYEIYTMNANGSSPTRLTNNTAVDAVPGWAPDGTKIAFHSSRDGNAEIYVMSANGSGQTRITNNPANDIVPDWQPLAYEAPQSAGSLHFALVPAFRQCGTGSNPANGQHSPPLNAGGSCNPPVPTSTSARVGPTGSGSADFTVFGNDVLVTGTGTDIRTPAGADYTGSVTALTRLRLTDLGNCSPSGCGGPYSKAGTTTEVDFGPVPLSCVTNGDPSLPPGSTCSVSTSVNSVVPGAVIGGRRTIVQQFRLRINDSGGTLFAQQGIYEP